MSKNTLLKPETFDGLPPWMLALRQAVSESVTPTDIKEIIANQVKRAKQGDQAAIKFLFAQLGGESLKGATFVQNNYHGDGGGGGGPPKLRSKPGSPQRIEEMRRRAESRQPLQTPGDATFEDEDHES